MKKLFLTLFLTIPLFLNEQGFCHEHQTLQARENKINQLYEKYPPTDNEWMHKVSKQVRKW